jgi:hypothetical protein
LISVYLRKSAAIDFSTSPVFPRLRGELVFSHQLKISLRSSYVFPNLLFQRVNGWKFDFRPSPAKK